VTATFEENETGWVDTSSATATAVRVEFKVKTRPPNNRCWYRHTYGVRETVECIQNPQLPLVSLVARGGGRASAGTFVCPIVEEECPIAVQCGEAEYIPSMVVIEPSGVMITTVWAERYSIPTNFPGGIGMGMRMYLLPNYVCFSGIAVYEVPNDDGWGVGYFTNQYFRDWLSHTRRIGAGEWCDVGEDNFVATDHPAIEVKIPHVTEDGLELSISGGPWQYGEIHMPTPMGWNEKGTRGHVVEFKRFAALEMQLMSLLENGQTGVRKYRNEVLRNIDGSIYINRRLQNESEIIDRSSGTN